MRVDGRQRTVVLPAALRGYSPAGATLDDGAPGGALWLTRDSTLGLRRRATRSRRCASTSTRPTLPPTGWCARRTGAPRRPRWEAAADVPRGWQAPEDVRGAAPPRPGAAAGPDRGRAPVRAAGADAPGRRGAARPAARGAGGARLVHRAARHDAGHGPRRSRTSRSTDGRHTLRAPWPNRAPRSRRGRPPSRPPSALERPAQRPRPLAGAPAGRRRRGAPRPHAAAPSGTRSRSSCSAGGASCRPPTASRRSRSSRSSRPPCCSSPPACCSSWARSQNKGFHLPGGDGTGSWPRAVGHPAARLAAVRQARRLGPRRHGRHPVGDVRGAARGRPARGRGGGRAPPTAPSRRTRRPTRRSGTAPLGPSGRARPSGARARPRR